MVSYVNVLGPRVLDIIAAKSNGTAIVTVHGNLIEGKAVVSSVVEIAVLFYFLDDQLTNLSPRN
ncbi:hypothetical protein Tco_0285968, partial [Tanacetum coccineum]